MAIFIGRLSYYKDNDIIVTETDYNGTLYQFTIIPPSVSRRARGVARLLGTKKIRLEMGTLFQVPQAAVLQVTSRSNWSLLREGSGSAETGAGTAALAWRPATNNGPLSGTVALGMLVWCGSTVKAASCGHSCQSCLCITCARNSYPS